MENEFKTNEIEEIEETVEVAEEKESEGFISKVKTGLRKHGKKILFGAMILACGFAGYALGKKDLSLDEDESDNNWDDDDDVLLIENDSDDQKNEK